MSWNVFSRGKNIHRADVHQRMELIINSNSYMATATVSACEYHNFRTFANHKIYYPKFESEREQNLRVNFQGKREH